ncbi:MAG: cyclic nucleotide-binding domain-containing protein [Spirulinaceae cyanobacterium]
MLRNFLLLSELGEEQRQEIEEIATRKFYRKGDVIFNEGDLTDEIYFILSGVVDLFKIEPDTQNNIKFKAMFPGESFGEMSFVDGSPRSCSVIAAEESELYVLDREQLLGQTPMAHEIINKLTLMTTRQVNSYLRYLSDRHAAELQSQINSLKERNDFGNFFIFLLILLFTTAVVNALVQQFFSESLWTSNAFGWFFLIVGFVLPLVLAAWKTKLSAEEIGLTTQNLKKSAIDGLIFSAIGVLLVVIVAIALDPIVPQYDFVDNLRNMQFFTIYTFLYLFHSCVQQAMRSIVHISLKRFQGSKHDFWAITTTGIIFSICHMHFGIVAILVTLISSFMFGFIYIRTYNLFGVSLFHFIMGFVVFKNLLEFQ